MTTIAVRDGVMASDSMILDGKNRMTGQKIYRLADGRFVGCAGDCSAAEMFVRFLNGGESFQLSDKERKDFCALVLKKDGTVDSWDDERIGWRVLDKFCAIGSGNEAACAAMHMGADAVKAVAIARLVNADTGGDVVSMSIAEQG